MGLSIAERMFRLFEGFDGAHGTFSTPEREEKPTGWKWAIRSSARTIRSPVTIELWEKHLKGEYPLGVMPLRADGQVGWGAIDVDLYDLDLTEVVKRIEDQKLKLIPVKSKSGGIHLFIFLEEFQPSRILQDVLRHTAARLGFGTSEVFPKQSTILAERGDLPSWIAAPYGTTFGGKLSEQAAIRRTGAELTVEEFLKLAEASLVTTDELKEMGEALPSRKGGQSHKDKDGDKPSAAGKGVALPAESRDSPFIDGPPCIQHLTTIGVVPGGQNNFLLQMGIYYKKKFPEEWKTKLEEANYRYLTPPGTMEGLLSVIRSLERKDYLYKCKDVPCVNYCNSSVCRTRRFGIGADGDYPTLGGIAVLDGDPPLWFVDVQDIRIELSTDELQKYPLFHAKCMEKIHKTFRAMKQDAWLSALGEAMASITVIEVPEDISKRGHFMEILNEFLTNRQRGEKRDDLFSGKPIEEDGKHYFRIRDLLGALDRGGLRGLTRAHVVQRIKDIGGGHQGFHIRDKYINVWFVPADALPGSSSITLPVIGSSPL